MRNCIKIVFFFLSLASYSIAWANVDEILRHANIEKLTQHKEILNLFAQLSDPQSEGTTNVEDLNEFGVIVSLNQDLKVKFVKFDKNEQPLGNPRFFSQLGTFAYTQDLIPPLSFQDGLEILKECITNKGLAIPDKITRILIYRSEINSQMIYDYAFKDPILRKGLCQEYLYTPDTGDCEIGMHTHCYMGKKPTSGDEK